MVVMVRRVTPSQLRSMVRQAEQKQRQAISNYNREVRNYNNKVRQAVSTYNREASAHNSRVRANRQRLERELSKLRSQTHSSTRYVTYTRSVSTLQRSFADVESAATEGAWSDSRNFLDLAEGEAANSVATLNALLAPSTDDEDQEPELRVTSLTNELASIDPELQDRWNGALFALSPQNPDAARHFCTSAREILASILDREAPDSAVKQANPEYVRTPNGGVSRRAKIQFFLARTGNYVAALAQFVEDDIDSVISLFTDFNAATHGGAGRFDLPQLQVIKTRVEHAIQFLHRLVR